jgi:hypothetical protein
MNDIKTLRDKLNGSLPMGIDENEELLQEQWNQVHREMEDRKLNDEENFMECK